MRVGALRCRKLTAFRDLWTTVTRKIGAVRFSVDWEKSGDTTGNIRLNRTMMERIWLDNPPIHHARKFRYERSTCVADSPADAIGRRILSITARPCRLTLHDRVA